jgi:hypothetical protein
MAAVAAVAAQRRITEKRMEKQRQKEEAVKFVQGVLKQFDVSRTGTIHEHYYVAVERGYHIAGVNLGSTCPTLALSIAGGLKWTELKGFLGRLHPERTDEVTEGEVTHHTTQDAYARTQRARQRPVAPEVYACVCACACVCR